MRVVIQRSFWAIWAAWMALGGCERSPAPAPVTLPPPKAAASQPVRPTTQELLSGAYQKLYLPGTPFSVMAPESWKVQNNGTINFLEGPTPADQIMIKISQFDPITAERYTGLVDRLVKEDNPQPAGTPKKNELRDADRLHIVERISAADPITTMRLGPRGTPDTDAQGNPIMITSIPIRWNLNIFVPESRAVSWYELNCIGLTLDQYNQDKDLISKVFASLRYDDPSLVPALPGNGVKP
jgi:hypothetical protein